MLTDDLLLKVDVQDINYRIGQGMIALEYLDEVIEVYNLIQDKRPLFNLASVLEKVGLDEMKHPKLAIARYDAEEVRFCFRKEYIFSGSGWRVAVGNCYRGQVRFGNYNRLVAKVPVVPQYIRDRNKLNDNNYYILWEPEWEVISPIDDPILCRRIRGVLFEIIDGWDLTELELSLLY